MQIMEKTKKALFSQVKLDIGFKVTEYAWEYF